jgi:hypothetical protein
MALSACGQLNWIAGSSQISHPRKGVRVKYLVFLMLLGFK